MGGQITPKRVEAALDKGSDTLLINQGGEYGEEADIHA